MGWFSGQKGSSSVSTSPSAKKKEESSGRSSEGLTTPSPQLSNKSNSRQRVTSSYQPPTATPETASVAEADPIISLSQTKNNGAAASQSQNSNPKMGDSPLQAVENNASFDASKMSKQRDSEDHSVVPEKTFSSDQQTYDDSAHNDQRTSSQNHLNSLFNGHLMKWKYEAEEGTFFMRVPAFLGGLSQIAVAITAFVLDRPRSVETHSISMYSCIIIMSLLILILDGRFLSIHPLNVRSHLRNIATRNFNILRFLWGRGLLYISVGILAIAQTWLPAIIAGSWLCFVGILALAVGIHASRKFAALRNSLADESFLLLVFANYDSDADGYIDPPEFSWLLIDLGVELDDRYTLKAFNTIDKDRDRLISFEEFSHWWSYGFVERGRKVYTEEDNYHRMDANV